MSEERVSRRRVGRVLLVVIALLAGVELLLRATGKGDPQERFALHSGLDDFARYLAPDELVPGGWRTQIYGDAGHELRIPPRDGRVRVLLLGGANMSAMPEERLAAALDAARPGRAHEVLNLGRPGYGSERVLILLRQALETLEPDVVVVYSGHNEFVEAGFAAELAREWTRPWFRQLATKAQRLRTVNLLVELLRPSARPPAPPSQPEPRGRREDLLDLQYAQTLIFYDVYRSNLRAICDASQRHGTPLVLCTVVGNHLAPPVVARHRTGLAPGDAQEFDRLREACLAALPARLVTGLAGPHPRDPPVRLHWNDWGEHLMAADRRDRAPRPPRTAPELRRLPPPLDGGPLWPDPSLWNPRVFELLGTASAFLARDLSSDERRAIEQAVDLARQAVALSPDHARAVFDLGLCLYLVGDTAEARESLQRAATLDCSPNRGNDLTNAIVRVVAAEHPEVALVDADQLFAQRTPDALISYEIVSDNCHLHPGARHVLMQDLVPPIRHVAAPSGR